MFRLGRSGLVRQVQRAGSRQYSTRNASGSFNRNLLIAAAVVPVTVVYALFNKVHVQNLPIDNERIETLSHALKQVVAGDDEEEKHNSKKNAELKQDKYNTSKENEEVLAKKAPTAQDPVAQRGQERDTTKEETTKENLPQISRKANKLEETKPESDSEEPAEKDEKSDSDKTAELKKEKAEQSNSNKEKLENAAPTAEDPVAQRSESAKSSGSETKEHLPQASKKADKLEETKPESEESGAGEAAYNPETGEINWDCPCLGGMAHGPCGEEFKEAFACFVYSDSEPKGIDCIKKFENMRSCFREHPEHYKEELYEDDQEESIVETKAAEAGAN